MKNNDGDVTAFEHDGLGRVIREGINIGDSGNLTTSVQFRTYEFDDNGNLITFTDRDNRVTSYGYDRLNRRTGEVSKDSFGAFTHKTNSPTTPTAT